MYQVTQPGLYHTAGADGLRGIDFGGKTGTAQVMSHEALGKTTKGKSTNPNVWFVGVTPTAIPNWWSPSSGRMAGSATTRSHRRQGCSSLY